MKKAIIKPSLVPIALFMILAGLALSCGPVNQKAQPAAGGGTGPAPGSQFTNQDGTVGSSQNGAFLVHSVVKSLDSNGNLRVAEPGKPLKPQLGKVTFQLRLVHGSNLVPISNEAKISVEYHHSKSKLPTRHKAQVERQEDGTYTFSIEFKKKGQWEIVLKVEDGSVKDEHAFLVKPEA